MCAEAGVLSGLIGVLLSLTCLLSRTTLAAIPGLMPEKNYDLSGEVSYQITVTDPARQPHSLDQMLRQRLKAEYRFNPDFRLNAGLRHRLIWGDTAQDPRYTALISQDPGSVDLSANWHESSHAAGNSQLERLYFTWNHQDWQVKGGRQRINWSMATIWNPNDLFNTYSLYEIDDAERPGTDALLISRKTGYASGIGLAYNPNQNHELTGYSGRWFFSHSGWDIQLLGGKSGFDQVMGTGFAGDILGAGFRGELSWFHPEHRDWQGRETHATLVSTLETDYSFAGDNHWLIKAAWLYISHPEALTGTVTFLDQSFLSQSLNARRLSFSRHSYYGEASVDLTALLRLTMSGIYYQDQSVYLSLSGLYSLADDWQLQSGVQYFGGPGSSLYGQNQQTRMYGLIRWNF
ncbi:hypothetical protein VA7868_02488 [Vibrio aerogenes CECT 7868]|uniref:Alginate export domain-containing protein n=1 Tax=Vibrio aerogenes CECT 7868 TaxID=1216006 RepID=A0A1M5ZAD7_9VIBR|nr:hypothetical protein [Vibrio aerogenes]SHI21180.1 hypothetical protein VA7868_02488 [Vibrio aerogenes CECT 7868]